MKTVIAKIRPPFLRLIQSGVKKREYRLANPKYTSLNVGDRLILVSNQNKQDFAVVKINKVTKYQDWESALEKHWEEDFKGLYSNFDELIKECYRFYSTKEVDACGIDVFEIVLDEPVFKDARYLFDTNIIIQRESMNNCCTEINLVYQSVDKFKGTKLYHSVTAKELNDYKDPKIKEAMITKLNSYEKLSESAIDDDYFKQTVVPFGDDANTKNDNEILYQVYSGRVDFLITEDRGVLRKARLLYLQNRVMNANEFLTRIRKENPSLVDYDALSVALVKIGSLNIKDCFFDSLREDYGGLKFNEWLTKKAESKAYVFRDNKGIQGFLYLKPEEKNEDYSDFNPPLKPKRRLKVGTFKINSTGMRLGERFLKIIFDNALKRDVDEIYVTMFKNKRKEVEGLKDLMEKWGFEEKGVKNNGEIYLVKNMREYNDSKDPKFNYPLTKDDCSISYLPISSKYHTKLFPDLHLKNEDATFFDKACSYAIEKIYVTAWRNVYLKPGSLLCVYCMADTYKRYRSVVTGTCILNEVIHTNSADELVKQCKNRSVFEEDELRRLFNDEGYKTIVKILYLEPFESKVNYNTLDINNLLDDKGPRLNSKLSKEQFKKLLKLGKGDNLQ